MPVAAKCPGCGTTYTVQEAMLGKTAKCKKCQNSFVIAASGKAPAPPGVKQTAAAAPRPAAKAPVQRPPAANNDFDEPKLVKKQKVPGQANRWPDNNWVLIGVCVGICFVPIGGICLIMGIIANKAASSIGSGSGTRIKMKVGGKEVEIEAPDVKDLPGFRLFSPSREKGTIPLSLDRGALAPPRALPGLLPGPAFATAAPPHVSRRYRAGLPWGGT
jgi:predicted Zn finger-like uncharacterized protein